MALWKLKGIFTRLPQSYTKVTIWMALSEAEGSKFSMKSSHFCDNLILKL